MEEEAWGKGRQTWLLSAEQDWEEGQRGVMVQEARRKLLHYSMGTTGANWDGGERLDTAGGVILEQGERG